MSSAGAQMFLNGSQRLSADELDEQRHQQMAYEYLCRLQEAQEWIQSCINEQLPPPTELEENLRNGVYLAKLANFFAPNIVPARKIFDPDQNRYQIDGLLYRHTDNSVQWLRAMENIGLPKIFFPETTDIYDKKNMPKVIYCLHALSLYLHSYGKSPKMKQLTGLVEFSQEEITAMAKELAKYGIQLPQFHKIGGILADEMPIDEAALHAAIIAINKAIDEQDLEELLHALKNPCARLRGIVDENLDQYHRSLFQRKLEKKENWKNSHQGKSDEESPDDIYDENLTQSEIQKTLRDVNVGFLLERIDSAIDRRDTEDLMDCLVNEELGLNRVIPDNSTQYLEALVDARQREHRALIAAEIEDVVSTVNRLSDEHSRLMKRRAAALFELANAVAEHDEEKCYSALESPLLGIENLNETLKVPYMKALESTIAKIGVERLTVDVVQNLISRTNADTGSKVTALQSATRGFITRRQLQTHQVTNRAATRIQATWRGFHQRKSLADRLDHFDQNLAKIVLLQSLIRMWINRHKYLDRKKHLKANEPSVVKLQSWLRGVKERKDYQELTHGKTPSLSVVQRFLPILQFSVADYEEELELINLKRKVVQMIRSSRQLEQDLEQMDIKIGLLVKNQITLQEVISHGKKLRKGSSTDGSQRDHSGTLDRRTGGSQNQRSKEVRQQIEAYEHLLYALQTEPKYLSRLWFAMPNVDVPRFAESVILNLFSCAADRREQYLLVKLFEEALIGDIQMNFSSINDAFNGNPRIITMMVNLYKFNSSNGESPVVEILKPVIESLLSDKDRSHYERICINPVEIHQKLHPTIGDSKVTIADAMKDAQVRKQFDESLQYLESGVTKLIDVITKGLNVLPYGFRYSCQTVWRALASKFPEITEKDLEKVIGNIVYFRFMHSSIVAPEAHGIIPKDQQLDMEQRKYLSSLSRILQFVSMNKGYGSDSPHLAVMNKFIRSQHERFREYFAAVCNVESPEKHFNRDEYSDFVSLGKPFISVQLRDLMNWHQELIKFEEKIAPNSEDRFHLLMIDAGRTVPVDLFNGAGLQQTDFLPLTLSSKFDVAADDLAVSKNNFLKAKRLMIDVLLCEAPSVSVKELLTRPSDESKEERHRVMVMQRNRNNEAHGKKQHFRQVSVSNDDRLTLAEKKQKVLELLKQLQGESLVTEASGYQELVNAIANDIRNQRRYRSQRKEELDHLRQAVSQLQKKSDYFKEKTEYYDKYVQSCLTNLADSNKRKSRFPWRRSVIETQGGQNGFKQKSQKFSGAKLLEKNVLLGIENMPENQEKNVMFEISTTGEPGVLAISAKFMGVDLEQSELNFQDLLRQQYDGRKVIKLFNDRVAMDVGNLIDFLNRKFFAGHLKK